MTHTSDIDTNACEGYEADLSAILDGELTLVDLPATLDHLVDCPHCAAFYRSSRMLDHAVSASRADESLEIEPHESVWRRISARASWSQVSDTAEDRETRSASSLAPGRAPRRSRRARLQEWAPRLAAVFVLAFGLWLMQVTLRDRGGSFFREGGTAARDYSDELATTPEEMSDQRFVALATEVLRADPKYHHEMLEVMESATRAERREATVDYRRFDEGAGLLGRSREGGEFTADGRTWK